MASTTVICDAGGDRTPLLHDSPSERSGGGEAEYPEPPPPPLKSSSDPKQRLVSLDVFRGLTVAVSLLQKYSLNRVCLRFEEILLLVCEFR